MKYVVHVVACLAALSAVGTACADLTPTQPAQTRLSTPETAACPPIQTILRSHLAQLDIGGVSWLAADMPLAVAPPHVPTTLPDPSEQVQVAHLPASPGSAALCFWALASLGVWQASKRFHLGMLPEWYHDAGPAQIGHATPLDLSFRLADTPANVYDCVPSDAGLRPSPRWLWPSSRDWHATPEIYPIACDPRGPPLMSA